LKTPRTSYFQQIARRPTTAPVVLHPPHQVLRRWEIAQRTMPAAAPAVPLKPKERKAARSVDAQTSRRTTHAEQSAAEPPGIAPPLPQANVIPDAPAHFPAPPPAAEAAQMRAVVEEQARLPRREAAQHAEKVRAFEQAPPPATRSTPASILPPAAAARTEAPSIEIGAIEVQIVPPPAPAPPARPAARRAPAPHTSLSRDFTATFGLRQG
jgi:hypothetical protein